MCYTVIINIVYNILKPFNFQPARVSTCRRMQREKQKVQEVLLRFLSREYTWPRACDHVRKPDKL